MTPILKDCNGNWIPNKENMEYLAKVNKELLEACEQLLCHVKQDEMNHGRPFAAGNVARAAIAKATGKE
jgi:hypothetical protein